MGITGAGSLSIYMDATCSSGLGQGPGRGSGGRGRGRSTIFQKYNFFCNIEGTNGLRLTR